MVGNKVDKRNNILISNTHLSPARKELFFSLFTIFIIHDNEVQLQIWERR